MTTEPQAPDVRAVEDWCAADGLLVAAIERAIHPWPIQFLERTRRRLCQQLDRRFRDRPVIDSEQAALNILRGAGDELTAAATALAEAAAALRGAGQGFRASQAHQAAQRAARAAQELAHG